MTRRELRFTAQIALLTDQVKATRDSVEGEERPWIYVSALNQTDQQAGVQLPVEFKLSITNVGL